jgi:hypothetical protein
MTRSAQPKRDDRARAWAEAIACAYFIEYFCDGVTDPATIDATAHHARLRLGRGRKRHRP